MKVSVIVCCHNAATTVARTLESLSVQTFSDFEIVAIDDGSQDETVEILEAFAARDPRLRVLRNGRNRGTAFSRQRGLDEARAEMVMFVDADDIAGTRLVERLREALVADNDLVGVGCYATYFTEEGKDLGLQCVGPESRGEFERVYREQKLLFMAPVTLFRKADALAVGGYRQDIMPNTLSIRYQDFCEDLDLWCRMSDLGAKGRYFLTLPESLLRYRKPIDSLSTKNLRHMQLKMRWIKDCLRRRRTGIPERTLETFIASRGIVNRFLDWCSDIGAGFFRRGAFAYSRRNYLEMVFYLVLTGLMSPRLLIQKFRTQRVGR